MEIWHISYRYSDFRKFYQNMKKFTANLQSDDVFFGLRCMVEYGLVNKQLVEERKTFTGSILENQNNFMGTSIRQSNELFKLKTNMGSYNTVLFPSRKIFNKSQAVIKQRMVDLQGKLSCPNRKAIWSRNLNYCGFATSRILHLIIFLKHANDFINTSCPVGFLNDLMDTRIAIVTRQIYFNILKYPGFKDFVDPDVTFGNAFSNAIEEQDAKIQHFISTNFTSSNKGSNEMSLVLLSEGNSHSYNNSGAGEVGTFNSGGAKPQTWWPFKKRPSMLERQINSDLRRQVSDSDLRLSTSLSRMNSTKRSTMFDGASKLNNSMIISKQQFCPDAEEVRNLYAMRNPNDCVTLLLKHLKDPMVLNKKEHTV